MTLKIYAVVLGLVRALAPYLPALRARSSSLGDQLERALCSIPLNVAEGAYSRGKNRQARYQSAAASAREALACLETAEALGWVQPIPPELGALFHRIIGTLVRPIEPRRRVGAARRLGGLADGGSALQLAGVMRSDDPHPITRAAAGATDAGGTRSRSIPRCIRRDGRRTTTFRTQSPGRGRCRTAGSGGNSRGRVRWPTTPAVARRHVASISPDSSNPGAPA